MKSIANFNMLTIPPRIVATRKTIEAIKHIVRIAPQEAQWFHSVTYDENDNALVISEELYIPEQVCSVVEVDTDSTMMVKFFKELMTKHGMVEANKIVASMNCWCHSHHNMVPSPSGQDVKQFNTLVRQIIDQGTGTWQIMLIFNKQDQFYSRIYDPGSGNIYEGINIEIQENAYDFSYIDVAAKEKFKSPVVKQFDFPKPNQIKDFSGFSKQIFTSSKENPPYKEKNYNQNIADSILQDAIGIVKDPKVPLLLTKSKANSAYKEIYDSFSEREVTWLYFLIKNNNALILKYDTDELAKPYFNENKKLINQEIVNYLTSTATYNSLNYKFCKIFEYDDCSSKDQLLHAIMETELADKFSKA